MELYKYKETKINILMGDITEQRVDAIVNAANNNNCNIFFIFS